MIKATEGLLDSSRLNGVKTSFLKKPLCTSWVQLHTQVLCGCSVVYVYSTFFALTDFISFEEPNLDLCWKANLAFWVQPIYLPGTELCK